MTVPDSPQLDCHHFGSFETSNVLGQIAIVQNTETVAATRSDNGFADRGIFLNHSIILRAGEYGVSRLHVRFSGIAPISPKSVIAPRVTSSRVGRAGARTYIANIAAMYRSRRSTTERVLMIAVKCSHPRSSLGKNKG